MSVALAGPARAPWIRFRAGDTPPLGAIFGAIGVLAVAAVGLLGLAGLPFPTCFFKAVSGMPCPTCGTTRALACLAHLDLAGAFVMNPLAAATGFAIAAWALSDLALFPRRRALLMQLRPDVARLARVAAVLLIALNWAYLIAASR